MDNPLPASPDRVRLGDFLRDQADYSWKARATAETTCDVSADSNWRASKVSREGRDFSDSHLCEPFASEQGWGSLFSD